MMSNGMAGGLRQARGRIKDGYGGIAGDAATQIDGKFDQAAGKFQSRFGDTLDEASERASDVKRRASEAASDLGARLRDTANTAQYQTRQAGEAVSDTVRQQPILSLIGAAAIGYLASLFIHALGRR